MLFGMLVWYVSLVCCSVCYFGMLVLFVSSVCKFGMLVRYVSSVC